MADRLLRPPASARAVDALRSGPRPSSPSSCPGGLRRRPATGSERVGSRGSGPQSGGPTSLVTPTAVATADSTEDLQLSQRPDLVAQRRGLFEIEVLRRGLHGLFEVGDPPGAAISASGRSGRAMAASRVVEVEVRHPHERRVDLLDDRGGLDPVLPVVGLLDRCAGATSRRSRGASSRSRRRRRRGRGPWRLRAARPDVWMSEVSLRRKPSLSASRIATTATSGRSRPSRSRLMPIRQSKTPRRKSARMFDSLERLDVGVEVPAAHADLREVVRQLFGHPLGQRRDEDALVARRPRSRTTPSRSSTWPLTGRISITGSSRPVGRMTCSTISPPACSSSSRPGVALT